MVNTTVALVFTVTTLAVFTGVGIWFSREKVKSVEDLITARNSTNKGQTTATLVASAMGVWILLSAPEAGALYGIGAVVGYGIGEAVPMLVYSKLGPRIRELIPDGHSLTEYAYARYGSAMYTFVIAISILYMFIFLAAELTGISLALHYIANVPQWQTAVLVGGFVLLYTGYGGLRASIVTDTIQTMLILPLLVASVVIVVFVLGGTNGVYEKILITDSTLLDSGFIPGIRFGIALIFAILGAELINQTWWQRIYATNGSSTVKEGFRTASIANGLILLLATLLGIISVGHANIVTQLNNENYNAGISFFVLLEGTFAEWVVLGVLLLALVLVMSTADTLFNALSSLVTADLPRLLDDPNDRTLRFGARVLTIVIAVAAIAVSLRAQSVLRLFFVADLLGAAVGFPLIYGLFNRRLSGIGALTSSLVGLAVGSVYFPFPFGLHEMLNTLFGGSLPAADTTYLLPFAGTFCISAGMTLITARVSNTEFDLNQLSHKIRRLDEPATDRGSYVDTDTEVSE